MPDVRSLTSVIAALCLAGCAASSSVVPIERRVVDVVELSVSEAAERLADGRLTSVELTRAYLARIAAVDDDGPTLDAVIELDVAVGRHTGSPMETRGALADFDPSSGVLTLDGASKVPHFNLISWPTR